MMGALHWRAWSGGHQHVRPRPRTRCCCRATDTPAPPSAALSVPVYSLVTGGDAPTANIVTYASPVSIQPRVIAAGLYRGTLSHENAMRDRRGILQILGKQHASLVPLLGKSSGWDTDKFGAMQSAGFALDMVDGLPILGDCCGWMAVEMVEGFQPFDCGDHDVVLWRVTEHSGPELRGTCLTTGDLRSQGLL